MSAPLHLAIAQLRPDKGEYAANLRRLGHVFAQLDGLAPRPQVVHLAETALTGYFVEGAVRDLALSAGGFARDLARVWAEFTRSGRPIDVVAGFYELWQHKLYNSALYATLGDGDPVIHHVHRKVFLPTYGLFDEERFVERGRDVRAFDTPWGRAAILVCEDAWHSFTGTLAALDGAQVVFISSAAPARGAWPHAADEVPGPANLARWERLARDIAEEHGVFVSLAHLTGSEGGKQFAGGSVIMGPKGNLLARAPVWNEAVLSASVDPGDIARARADMPLLSDFEVMLPHLQRSLASIEAGERTEVAFDPAPCDEKAPPRSAPAAPPLRAAAASAARDGVVAHVHADAWHHAGPPPLELDAALAEAWLVGFLRDEMRARGFERAVIGVSGGVDSAVTAFLAARALGPKNVVGVRMPYRTSSRESLEHAQLVIDALGVESRTVDISAAVDGYLAHEPDADPARRGNVMARVRMIALFDLSAKYRALPLGTGNKTERLFGYFTWHADDSPPVNPLGDLFKTQVWTLARHLGVPEVIVSKPATADLVMGQTDEGDFGITYAKADRILNWMVAGYSDADLRARGFEPAEVAIVRRRLEGTHWKRKLPTVAMLGPTAIGESYLRPVDY
ncbi:MAG TPA: NAD+ synthase [Gemmatimonadaceae bacterium]|nr:NAD+ synthase [Gemmatimonadaceae bacterium]